MGLPAAVLVYVHGPLRRDRHLLPHGLPHHLGRRLLPVHPEGAGQAAPAVGCVQGQAGAEAGDPRLRVPVRRLAGVPLGGAERPGAGVQPGLLYPAPGGVRPGRGDLQGEAVLAASRHHRHRHRGHRLVHLRLWRHPLCDHRPGADVRRLRRHQKEPDHRLHRVHYLRDTDDGPRGAAVYPVLPHG